MRPTHLSIDVKQLKENFKQLKILTPFPHFLCPMIKANAYGHGDTLIAKALQEAGCDSMGVASVEEGIQLRQQNLKCKILVFGFYGPTAAAEILHYNLTPVVSNLDQVENLSRLAMKPLAIHLKFNTGMNRLGFTAEDLVPLQKMLKKSPYLKVVGLGTHLYLGADICELDSRSFQQINLFKKWADLFAHLKPVCHVYNSAAITALHRSKQQFEYGFRPGLLVYGVDPEENLSLRPLIGPVMTFKSKIVAIQEVKSGDVVSYGGTWQAAKDSLIAIVPAGYGDGISRTLSNVGEVLVKERRVPIRGRVCMDYTMIDISSLGLNRESALGQEVVFIGKQGQEEISVLEVALTAGRVNYEIMTAISERVPRVIEGA